MRKFAIAVAVALLVGGFAGDAGADPIERCTPVPVSLGSHWIVGQEVPGLKDVELCVTADQAFSGEPQLRNYEGCGDPCFAVVVRDLKVSFDVLLKVRYTLGDEEQPVIPLGTGRQTVEPLSGTHNCIYGYSQASNYNPCQDGISTPDNLRATGGRAKVSLAWSKSFAFGESRVADYEVLRSDSGAEGTWTALGTTSNLSFVDTSVNRGTTYWYTVVAIDSTGARSGAAQAASATVK